MKTLEPQNINKRVQMGMNLGIITEAGAGETWERERMRRLICTAMVLMLSTAPHLALAQSLTFTLSKAAIDCIATNAENYVAASRFDFAIIFPEICPDLPEEQPSISNEFLNLPETIGNNPGQSQAILVPFNRFDCLRFIASETESAATSVLFLIDLDNCSFHE
jgi:hypothetical protein